MKIYIPNPNNKGKETITIHNYDVWSMDYTLAKIIHPMLVLLKKNTHGAPCTDYEDVPEHLRPTNPPKDAWETDEFFFARWDWVMDELIWTFDQLKGEECWDLIGNDYQTYWDRINNGLRLFGKYYTGLWD